VHLVGSKVRYQRDIRLSYLDLDEDLVVVDSTDELIDAIEQFADARVLRLFVGDVTPSMREEYLASGGGISGADGKKLFPIGGTVTAEMEKVIERQIEQVLEKRFRALVEQRKREQEGGGKDSQPQPQQQQQQQHHSHPLPPTSPSPRHHLPHARSGSPSILIQEDHYRRQQQVLSQQQQRRHSYAGRDAWDNSPRAEGEFPSTPGAESAPDDILGEEDYLPNSNHKPPPSYSIRLPWENTANISPFPPTSRPPHHPTTTRDHHHPTTHKNGKPEKSRTDYNRYVEKQEDEAEFDLSRQEKYKSPRKAQSPPSGGRGGVGRTNRNHHSGRDATPTNAVYRRQIEVTEDDDYKADYYDVDEDDMRDEMDDNDDDYDQTDSQYWETGTVDSDAELSMLLSDAGFQDGANRDEAASLMSEEQRQDENVHTSNNNNARSPRSPPSNNNNARSPRSPPPPQAVGNNSSSAKNTRQPHERQPAPPTTAAMSSQAPTPTASNTKQQQQQQQQQQESPARVHNFNSIPRPKPTPPLPGKKNKLLGILYSGA